MQISKKEQFAAYCSVLLFKSLGLFFFKVILKLIKETALVAGNMFATGFSKGQHCFFLPLVKILRRLNMNRHMLIAVAIAIDVRYPFAAQPE